MGTQTGKRIADLDVKEGDVLICTRSRGVHTVGVEYVVEAFGKVPADAYKHGQPRNSSSDWYAEFIKKAPEAQSGKMPEGMCMYADTAGKWPEDPLCPKVEQTTDTTDPSHYKRFPIQPMTFIVRNNLPTHKGDPIKYICRAGSKLYPDATKEESEIKDLEKAKRWINARINLLNGETNL